MSGASEPEIATWATYVWLANRLPWVRRRTGDKVSWAALQAQFGADMKDPKKFRRDDLKAFRQALAVYPDAKVEQVDGGLLLKPSPPPIRRKVHAVTKG